MDEGTLGKDVRDRKLNTIFKKTAAAIVAVVVMIPVSSGYASQREIDLFDKAYESYLSYQPEKAVEAFKELLREFPESSARDVTMFWLGKSLIGTRSFDAARRVFSELKEQFPESPLIAHVERERELIEEAERQGTRERSTVKASESKEERDNVKVESGIRNLERDLSTAMEEKKRLEGLMEEERRKAVAISEKLAEIEKREAELKTLLAGFEERQKRSSREVDRYQQQPKDLEVAVTIGDRRYSGQDVINFMASSSLVISRLGVRDVPWRSGNILEDFIDERVLADEARRANVSPDVTMRNEIIRRFNFTVEEADYLDTYLTIAELLDRKVKSMPEERVVQSLTVSYTEADKHEKVALAAELQGEAKAGRSFEEISRLFRGKAKFSVMRFQELQGWVKDRIELLRDGEISVVWTKDGYMILKPVLKRPSLGLLEEDQGRRNEIRAHVREWTEELRKGVKGISIVFPE